jgi:Ulp1 protease family, C-terminal catalytic domain
MLKIKYTVIYIHMAEKDYALSNIDLQKLMNDIEPKKINIVDDSRIKRNMNLEELFKSNDYLILFHAWKGQTAGHWITMTIYRHNRSIFYFDSFGDTNKIYFPLIDMCKDQGYNLYVNTDQFQNDDAQCCGKYAMLCIACRKMGLTPYQFIDLLKKNKKNLDKLIIKLVKQ